MKKLIIACLFVLKFIRCHDSKSSEGNRIETAPFYETIIFSDIADVINEFDNNINAPLDVVTNSENESDENIEDLLSEYQNYLEKAHKQRKDYIEKIGNKNKVPLVRREKFIKGYPSSIQRNNYYHNSNKDLFNPTNIFLQNFNSPLDLLIPLNTKAKQLNDAQDIQFEHQLSTSDKIIYNNRKNTDLSPSILKHRNEAINTSCFCKNGRLPCKCNCKQCLIPFEPISQIYNKKNLLFFDTEDIKNPRSSHSTKKTEFNSVNSFNDVIENSINVRIKIDVQVPKTRDGLRKYYKNLNRDKITKHEESNSKEHASIVNLPYFNFPIPLDLVGYTKSSSNKHDSNHHMSMHKKKKLRPSSINKKQRKKLIAFNDIKIMPPLPLISIEDNYSNSTDNVPKYNINKTNDIIQLRYGNDTNNINNTSTILRNTTNENTQRNDTQLEETVYFLVNISNSNTRDDFHKMENSIEADYAKTNQLNFTTKKIIPRIKREPTNSTIFITNNTILEQNITKLIIKPKTNEKNTAIDSDLLYWPNIPKNNSIESFKNITTMIFEKEYKKAKLNISKETIRLNHTIALERAIFGQVDWNDMDTVVPTFLSLVGKYIKGMLTFCSSTTCHSMRCAEKTCVHRTCRPEDRLNQRGHCGGSNTTDSMASMESIMDLPSNIAFEIIDILQDKMLGKLFGKVTLCITAKCISFIAAKKKFLKSKCLLKELNKTGHCPNLKNVKNM